MDWASTVAVVVPSPATSEVLEATSRTICAPMFSRASGSSISLATVTPSLVMVGEPNFFSRTTLRPLGPRVTLTALASLLTPARILAPSFLGVDDLLSSHCSNLLYFTTMARISSSRTMVCSVVVDLDVGSRVLADEHDVAGLHRHGHALALVIEFALADGDDFRFLRLFLGGVRNDDAATDLLGGLDPLQKDPVIKRRDLHLFLPFRFKFEN
jgi:hypothetical protein